MIVVGGRDSAIVEPPGETRGRPRAHGHAAELVLRTRAKFSAPIQNRHVVSLVCKKNEDENADVTKMMMERKRPFQARIEKKGPDKNSAFLKGTSAFKSSGQKSFLSTISNVG